VAGASLISMALLIISGQVWVEMSKQGMPLSGRESDLYVHNARAAKREFRRCVENTDSFSSGANVPVRAQRSRRSRHQRRLLCVIRECEKPDASTFW
jgi:hypothetical protein